MVVSPDPLCTVLDPEVRLREGKNTPDGIWRTVIKDS